MSETFDDRRKELCSQFRKSLADGSSSSKYFDEDELVELFDYAGDLNDDYLRMEVLLCGARYYPDSKALKERRALLYYTLGDDLTGKYLEDNASQRGAIWDITRMRSAGLMGAQAEEALDLLLKEYAEFDDEEIIQLVDLASSLGQTDWLMSRLENLRAHVTYLPTLLYEIAVMLELENRYDEAITLLEELTDLEPYNEQYWFMLAQEFELNDNVTGALQALDLALAILPEDKAMRFYHARLMANEPATQTKAIAALEKLAEEFPDDMDISRFLAALYIDTASDDTAEEAGDEAAAVLRRCYGLNRGNRRLATDMLAVGSMPPEQIIAEINNLNPPADITEWIKWSKELSDLKDYKNAAAILHFIDFKLGYCHPSVNEALINNYFMMQNFEMVCKRFETSTHGDSSATPDEAALIFVQYAISLCKLGRTKEAASFSRMIIKAVVEDGDDNIQRSLCRLGVGLVLTDIEQRCNSRRKIDWSDYDPLCAWLHDKIS